MVSFSRLFMNTRKPNKMTCATIEDSDQPGHPPSLIRVLAGALWVVKDPYFLQVDSEDSDQTRQMSTLERLPAGFYPTSQA